MTIANAPDQRALPAMPPRPARRLSTLQMLKIGRANSLALCDEELFDELFLRRRFLWYRYIAISDPAGVRRVLQDNCDNYPRVDQIRRVFEFGSGGGMLAVEGETSRRHRRLINPTLDQRAILADVPVLSRLAEALAEQLLQLPPGQNIDIGPVIQLWLTRATGHLFAGDDPDIDGLVRRMAAYPGRYSFLDLLPALDRLGFIIRWWTERREAEMFRPLLDRLIGERQSANYAGGKDLVWRLVNARDRQTGNRLSREELRDEILTLGSTAATPLRPLCWIWYLLATHPWAEEKLHAELDEVLGGRAPTQEDLAKLVYLRQVIDETMRLYPPLPLMLRVAADDDVVCGQPIPRRSIIGIMPWVIHRHRKLWDDPDRFDPERFRPDRAAARSRYSYLPFAIGPHVCVGASLAMTEMLMLVAVLAQRLRFRLVPGHPIEPIAWTNLRPRRGIRLTVERRVGPRVAHSAEQPAAAGASC